MGKQNSYTTTVSIESKVSASSLFQHIRELLKVDPTIEAVEYATELYFSEDDEMLVRVNLEFGEDDGAKPLFDDEDDDGYVNPHVPYAEISLNTNDNYISSHGAKAKDVHAFILLNLSEWFDDHNIEWGYYSDSDPSGKWISGEFPVKYGKPEKIEQENFKI